MSSHAVPTAWASIFNLPCLPSMVLPVGFFSQAIFPQLRGEAGTQKWFLTSGPPNVRVKAMNLGSTAPCPLSSIGIDCRQLKSALQTCTEWLTSEWAVITLFYSQWVLVLAMQNTFATRKPWSTQSTQFPEESHRPACLEQLRDTYDDSVP